MFLQLLSRVQLAEMSFAAFLHILPNSSRIIIRER